MADPQSTTIAKPLAEYKSHKTVRAGKIKTMQQPGTIDTAKWVLQIEAADGSETEIKVDPSVFARAIPAPGNYLVIYSDGYTSWSPAASFEEGYQRITPV